MPPTPARSTAPSRARSRALSRRAALGLAASTPLALVLSACSGSEAHDRLDSGVDRLRAPRSTPPAPPNPDQKLVDQAATAIAGMRSALLPHRSEGAAVTDLVNLHTAHLKALGAAHATGAATSAGSVMAQLAAREQALATLLAAKASAAQDGGLARLFASMSAAIAQRTANGLA